MDALLKWTEQKQNQSSETPKYGTIQEEAWLLGQPALGRYLDYVKEKSIGYAHVPSHKIVDEWRAANDYYAELELREAGFADQPVLADLDSALRPLADDVMADSRWARAFDEVPTQFAMVELDRLIVSQLFVNLDHTARLASELGSSPSAESLFRFCFPIGPAKAPVQVRRAGSNRFLFWSESSDFRFHEPTLIEPDQINGYKPFGAMGGIVGLIVGYGSNFLNAIRYENRVVLHNGYHRAYALRSLGFTHVPCIVQTVTRGEELNLVAGKKVSEDAGFYFKAARPPVLKDFFDQKIRKVLQIPKMLRMIEVTFETKEIEIIDFTN